MGTQLSKSDFEFIYHANGTCTFQYCGKPGVVLAYDEFSPEAAHWLCVSCWQDYEGILTIVEDKRPPADPA